jgi:hypothetical protein
MPDKIVIERLEFQAVRHHARGAAAASTHGHRPELIAKQLRPPLPVI